MVKLKTNQQFRYGKKNIIPYAQEVEIDENGYIEVPEDIASKIVESNCGFEFADGQSVDDNTNSSELNNEPLGLKADINDELNKSNQSEEEDDGGDNITAEQAKQALSIKTLQELKDMCKQSNFPSNEWRNLNKEEVVEYLSVKLAQ